MNTQKLKQILKQAFPPFLWDLLKKFRYYEPYQQSEKVRIIKTLEELDIEIARADKAERISDDALRKFLTEFRFEPSIRLPSNPYSPEYWQAQMKLYYYISGRSDYSSDINEVTDFDLDLDIHINTPFPYSTRSSNTLGEQLIAIGVLIRAMSLHPGDRILEFGPGWGKTTIELAQLGYAITAVDINPKFIELIQARACMLGLDIDLVCLDMLNYHSISRFDRVVFYECFHHCSDHIRMIKQLDSMVTHSGMVIFAGEPILDDFPIPWGIRLDGMSVWSTRKYGWLELGFQTDYFTNLLKCYGWITERINSHGQRLFVARKET